MKYNTDRLYLIPLMLDDLRKGMVDRRGMAAGLGLDPELEQLDETMQHIYSVKARNIERDPEHYLFYTYWQMVLKEERKIVGEIGFKGIGAEGEVEVGYGTEEGFRGKGYMTEALRGLLKWAFSQKQIKLNAVTATTDRSNLASQKVLLKAGLNLDREDESFYYWRIDKRG